MNQLPSVTLLRAKEVVFRRLPETWQDLPRVAFLPHETADTVFADTDSHALIPELNSQLRRSKDPAAKNRRDEWARILQILFKNQPVVGPYEGKS